MCGDGRTLSATLSVACPPLVDLVTQSIDLIDLLVNNCFREFTWVVVRMPMNPRISSTYYFIMECEKSPIGPTQHGTLR